MKDLFKKEEKINCESLFAKYFKEIIKKEVEEEERNKYSW